MLEKLAVVPDAFFARDGKKLSLLAYLFLIVLCVGFFTPGLVTMPPTDRDESLYAQASKQMVESGNYIDIRYRDEARYKKPILIYWLQSTAARVFEPHQLDEIWAYRIPSFVGATVAVLLTAALGTLLFNSLTGLAAAIILAGCALMNAEARLATTDACLLACIMAAMYGMARVYLPCAVTSSCEISTHENTMSAISTKCSWQTFLLFWTAIAFGLLLKGPLILLPMAAVLLWLRINEKNIRWFRNLRPLPGILYTLALAAPWLVTITMQSHGTFLQQSAGHDMLAKIWQGQNRGVIPPGAFFVILPLLIFPYALFVAFAAPDAWKSRREPAVKFCLGWIIPTWLVFEVSLTKLPHYVLPTFPAIALLTAKFLLDGYPTIANTNRRFPIVLVVGFWLMVGSGFAYVFAVGPAFIDNRWNTLQIIAGGILVVTFGATLLLLPRQKMGSLVMLTLGSLIFMSSVFGSMIPNLQHIWVSREIIEAIVPVKPCMPTQIISVGYHEPSLVFLGGTDTILAPDGVEAAKVLKENRCRVAVIDEKHKQEFLNSFANEKQKPRESGVISGLNAGQESQPYLTVYVLPLIKQ